MAYKRDKNGGDGWLVLSLDGAPSRIATLLHDEDDIPRKYYFSTDAKDDPNNPLQGPAFLLRCEGLRGSPVPVNVGLQIAVLKP